MPITPEMFTINTFDAIIRPIESIEKPNYVNKSVIVAIIPPFSGGVAIAN